MMRYKELIEKYDALVKETLAKNKSILEESFIEYFGEGFRTKILKNFADLIYVYYLNWNTIELVCNKVSDEKREKYKPYFAFQEARNDFYHTFIQGQILPNNFIGTTDETIFLNFDIYTYILKRINDVGAYTTLWKDDTGTKRIICFNLFLTDEEVLIHEINHAITRDWILEKRKNNITKLIDKAGLTIDDDGDTDEEILEELLTEKSSMKIYEIFKRRGGDLTAFLMGGIYGSVYGYNLYLVDKFFDIFEEKIKIARMGDNKNFLLESVGRESYYLLSRLISQYYVTDGEPISQIKEYNLDRVLSVVSYMEEYAKHQERLTDEDLMSYYQHLIKLGKKVTVLNKVI